MQNNFTFFFYLSVLDEEIGRSPLSSEDPMCLLQGDKGLGAVANV